jgi:hypothetical protein
VDVETAAPRRIEHGLRQDQAIGRDDGDVEIEGREQRPASGRSSFQAPSSQKKAERPSSAQRSAAVDPSNPFTWHNRGSFDYVDERGELLYQVVRLESGEIGKDGKPVKTFLQRQPDPSERSGWNWKVAGVRQVPYRLPELMQAIADGLIVFIVEGEKAAEAMRERGMVATCNSGGAGKFPDDLVPYFKGAEVVILADNDPQAQRKDGTLRTHPDGSPVLPGQDHARAVAAKLAPVAAKITVIEFPELPPKGDVVDFFESGKTADDLYERVHNTPVPTGAAAFASRFHAIPWADLENPGPEHEWLIKGILTRGERSMLVGPSQSGKSFLCLDLAMSIARGEPFFGLRSKRGGVVYQAGEGGKESQGRQKAAASGAAVPRPPRPPPPAAYEKAAVEAFVRSIATAEPEALPEHTAAFRGSVRHQWFSA